MFANLDEAVKTVQAGLGVGEETYRIACEYVVEHRDLLTFPLYIDLPGGMGGNSDRAWEKVKAGSDERCGCGNERVIHPGNPRQEFEASESGPIVLSAEKPLYVKPIGGDKASTYVQLSVEQGAIIPLNNPFAPFVLTPDIFTKQGYELKKLADAFEGNPGKKAILYTSKKVPVLAITAIDLVAETITISLDKANEVFDPEKWNDSGKHNCNN